MTATTQTLAAWLLDRIAADEAAVKGATHWQPIYTPGASIELTHDGLMIDPAHVVAVCAAHRAIVELHSGPSYGQQHAHLCVDSMVSDNWCETLRAVASIYTGREGWREEWAL